MAVGKREGDLLPCLRPEQPDFRRVMPWLQMRSDPDQLRWQTPHQCSEAGDMIWGVRFPSPATGSRRNQGRLCRAWPAARPSTGTTGRRRRRHRPRSGVDRTPGPRSRPRPPHSFGRRSRIQPDAPVPLAQEGQRGRCRSEGCRRSSATPVRPRPRWQVQRQGRQSPMPLREMAGFRPPASTPCWLCGFRPRRSRPACRSNTDCNARFPRSSRTGRQVSLVRSPRRETRLRGSAPAPECLP
jgi:hypothetical protein